MEKNYIKSFCKKKTFDNGGSIIGMSVNLEELSKLPTDKYGNVKIDLCERREEDQYGNTHYIVENKYKKEDSESESVF